MAERLTSQVSSDACPSITSPDIDASPWVQPSCRGNSGGARQKFSSSLSGPSQLVTSGSHFAEEDDSMLTEQEQMQKLIDQYKDVMPTEIKVPYFDVMILYAENDRELAEIYKHHLMNDIELEGGRKVEAVLYDDQELVSLAGGKFKSLELGFQRCTFAFIYLTKEFCLCEWSTMSSEECLMESIYNKDKKWCVVPVYTVQRSKADFKIPMGLNSLKGVNYYNNDDFYKRGLRRLIGDKVHVRVKNNKDHFEKQYRWACNERNKERIREQQRREQVAYEDKKKRQLEEELQRRDQYTSAREPVNHSYHPDYAKQKHEEYGFQPSKTRLSPAEASIPHFGPQVGKSVSVDFDRPRHQSEYSPTRQASMQDERLTRREASVHDESKIHYKERHGSPKGFTRHGPSSEIQESSLDLDYMSETRPRGNYPQVPVTHAECLVSSKPVIDPQPRQLPESKPENVVVHHHYYIQKEDPPQVHKTYNIIGAENVIIGEQGTIVSDVKRQGNVNKNEEQLDATEERAGRNERSSLQPSSVQDVDGKPSRSLSVEQPQSLSQLDIGTVQPRGASSDTSSLQTVQQTGSDLSSMSSMEGKSCDMSEIASNTPRKESNGITALPQESRAIKKPESSNFSIPRDSTNERRSSPFDRRPMLTKAPQTLKQVAAVPPLTKPRNQNISDEETSVKNVAASESTHVKEVDNSQTPSEEVQTSPKSAILSNQSQSSTYSKNQSKHSQLKSHSQSELKDEKSQAFVKSCQSEQTNSKSSAINHPLSQDNEHDVEMRFRSTLPSGDHLEEDCGSSSDASGSRESDGFIQVDAPDLQGAEEALEVSGTDVDTGFTLTERENALECVKQAKDMGYKASVIKQGLMKLRTKREKMTIHKLIDVMEEDFEILDTNKSQDKSGINNITQEPIKAEHKSSSTSGFTWKFTDFFKKNKNGK